MNVSSESAEQMVRILLEGFEVSARVTGAGAKNVAVMLYAIMKDNKKSLGKTNLINMLKSGKELKVFSVKKADFELFAKEAKQYGVLYSALNKKSKNDDGIVDIMVRAEDASKINRIVDRFKLNNYDEVTIRNNIEKTLSERNDSLNPNLALAEKSPRSKPSLKMQKTLNQSIENKKSVRKKLNAAKMESKKLNNSQNRSKIQQNVKKRKNERGI